MTKNETTGDRDLALSLRRRKYGAGVPAADIDWIVVEADFGVPKALIDYKKHWTAYRDKYSRATLTALACGSRIPFLEVAYWEEVWDFEIVPVNGIAKRMLAPVVKKYGDPPIKMNEEQFVGFLYWLRDKPVPKDTAVWQAGEMRGRSQNGRRG